MVCHIDNNQKNNILKAKNLNKMMIQEIVVDLRIRCLSRQNLVKTHHDDKFSHASLLKLALWALRFISFSEEVFPDDASSFLGSTSTYIGRNQNTENLHDN